MHRKRHKRNWRTIRLAGLLVVVLLMTLFMTQWRSGRMGIWLTRLVAPTFFPLLVGDVVELTTLGDGDPALVLNRGLMVIIAPARLRAITQAIEPRTRFLPPNTLRDGLVLTGAYVPGADARMFVERLPLVLILDSDAGNPPRLSLRLTADELNLLLREELQDKMRVRKRYFLGHADLTYRIRLESLVIRSVDEAVELNPAQRVLEFDATGEVKLKLKENLLDVAGTMDLERLRGRVTLAVTRYADGIGLDYDLRVNKLDLDINNVNAVLDHMAANRIEEAIEQSLNQRKRKSKVAAKRLPEWVPSDTQLDLRIASDGE